MVIFYFVRGLKEDSAECFLKGAVQAVQASETSLDSPVFSAYLSPNPQPSLTLQEGTWSELMLSISRSNRSPARPQ